MSYEIKKVAVLGAGVMGTGIAAHLANAGIASLLFDIVPKDAKRRSCLAEEGIKGALKAKPAAFYNKDFATRITPCNYDDDTDKLATCDLIIEVVVERLDIKAHVYKWVENNRKKGAIVASNTSGISLEAMAAPMSKEMREHFMITHFFNPVRYMALLELVTGKETLPAVVDAVAKFGDSVLGKGIVFGKDTPNFVANRIGTYGMASALRAMSEANLNIETIDAIFGSALGRPKSAVFRTGDLVGIDTLVHVFSNVYDNATDDEERELFRPPDWVKDLVANGALGAKSGAGFFKKDKIDGKKVILSYDLETKTYTPTEKPRYKSIGAAKRKEDPAEAIKAMLSGDDEAAKVAWRVIADTAIYSANRLPEIADDIVNIDNAMRWGFGWATGPFQTWDAIGVAESVKRMESEGRVVPSWVKDMLAAGRASFYERDDAGVMNYWCPTNGVSSVPTPVNNINVKTLRATNKFVHRTASATLLDMGDGALLLEFHSKMNALDELIFEQYERALDLLDDGKYEALVVGNQGGKAFSAGANILMILMNAMQQNWSAIDEALVGMQGLLMRAKYSKKPVVVAPYSLTLGGGAEVAMQCTATVAAAELYMGLVEVGVGLIPAGGGCKEMMVRYLGDLPQSAAYDPNPLLQKAFEQIGMGKVATSAEEARAIGMLRPTDTVVINGEHLLGKAKRVALGLAAAGITPPAERTIKVPGRSGRATIELFLQQMMQGGYASEHDILVGSKLANVLTGGDVPNDTILTEHDLLDLEREAFLSLCGEPKTLERIQYMLEKGKPLRN